MRCFEVRGNELIYPVSEARPVVARFFDKDGTLRGRHFDRLIENAFGRFEFTHVVADLPDSTLNAAYTVAMTNTDNQTAARAFTDTLNEQNLMRSFAQDVRSHSQSDYQTFVALQHELRRIARAKMRRERPDHTLQPTALVNEAFLKILRGAPDDAFWADTSKVLRYITHAMGEILHDHADAYNALRRGGQNKQRVPLDQDQAREFNGDDPRFKIDSQLLVNPERAEAIIATRTALDLLRKTAARQALVVELMFYGGLTQVEIAATLGISVESVKLDWRKAKAFLKVGIGVTE